MKKQKYSLTNKSYVVPFILVTTLFFLWGFARAILDVLNKHFQTSLNISITQSAFVQVSTYLAYFLMAIPAGMFITRFGYRKGVVFGLSLYAIGALLFIPSAAVNTFSAFLIALLVIACGLTFLEVSANPYVTLLGPVETSTSRLNLAQSFNGLGCVIAPLVVGRFLFSSSDADVSLPYTIMGIMVLVIALIFSKVNLPEIQNSTEIKESNTSISFRQIFSKQAFTFGLCTLLAYEISEISINSYFINFTTGQGWLSNTQASDILALSLLFFMIGRFVGSWLMRFIAAKTMLLICAIGSVCCIAVVLMNIPEYSLAALVLNYAFESIMFPTIYSLSLSSLTVSETKKAGSVLMMTPVGGCFFLLMGIIADNTTLVLPFVIPLIGFVIILGYAGWLRRMSL